MSDKKIVIHPVYSEYGCDSLGNVFSFKYGKIRKLKLGKNKGYFHFSVYENGKCVRKPKVHQFVFECFNRYVPEYSIYTVDGLVIHHRNNIRNDNRIENLELTTNGDNLEKQIERHINNRGKYPRYICWDKKNKKFRVSFTINKKEKYFGCFSTLDEAILQRNKICEELNIKFIEKSIRH